MAQNSQPREDPFPAYRFYITLVDSSSPQPPAGTPTATNANSVAGAFSECSGLQSTMEVHEYKEGGLNDRVLKFPTRAGFTNITLKKGMGITDDLWRWYYDHVQGIGKRRDGFILLMNQKGEPVKTWHFKRGLPLKWTGPELNAAQNALAIESLEISHEGFDLMPPDH